MVAINAIYYTWDGCVVVVGCYRIRKQHAQTRTWHMGTYLVGAVNV